MPKYEKKLFLGEDLFNAMALLTRIPTPWTNLHTQEPERDFAASAWAWPLIGAGLGLIAGCIGLFTSAIGAPAGISAGVILAAMMMMTGALHEDGLADTFDGFWGGNDKARRLEIMKDSHIGTYGVLALCLSVLLRWSALTAFIHSGWLLAPLMAAAALSRAPMAVLMGALPNARGTGLAQITGKPSQQAILAMLAVVTVLGLFLIGWNLIEVAFWITLVTIALAALAKDKIGGQTGDVLGASQQLGEIVALSALAALIV